MNAQKLFVRFSLGTVVCFALSYVCSAVAGKTGGESPFPLSIVKSYSEQGQNTLSVKNDLKLPISQVQELDLHTVATEIRIKVVDSSEIEMHLEGQYPARADGASQVLQYEVKGNALLVKTEENDAQMGFQFSDDHAHGVLTLMLPKKLKRMILKSVAGKISGEGLHLDTLNIETISGEIDLDDFTADTLAFKTISGDINLDGNFKMLNGQTVSGEMEIFSVQNNPQVQLNSTSGSVELSFASKPNAKLNFHTTSGSIRIEPAIGTEVDTASPYEGIFGAGQGSLQITTVSSSLHLDREESTH